MRRPRMRAHRRFRLRRADRCLRTAAFSPAIARGRRMQARAARARWSTCPTRIRRRSEPLASRASNDTPRTASKVPFSLGKPMRRSSTSHLLSGCDHIGWYVGFHSLRGSSTSRSPSPSRLKARLTIMIATPGTVTTHQHRACTAARRKSSSPIRASAAARRGRESRVPRR